MPEIDSLIAHVPAHTQVKGIALTLVDEMIAAGISDRVHGTIDSRKGLPPPINLLAFGSLRYSDVWSDSSYTDGRPLNEFPKLRTFAIDYCTTSSGDLAPVLTQVSHGPTCGIPDKYENISILQPYWLTRWI